MAITNPDFIYVAKYDIYVQRSTRTFWKRCHRGRKTEITEDELVLMDKFCITRDEYIKLCISLDGKTCNDCISYVFAEAFPELVGNADLHAKYPYLYTELNHKSHVHNTWESNYPECMEWLPVSVNRADTSRNVEKNNPDEKRLRHSKRMKDWYQKKKQNPEWVEKRRKHDAENKRKYYQETRPLRKQQEVALAEHLQARQQVAALLSDAQVRNQLEELLRKQQADDKHQLAVTD